MNFIKFFISPDGRIGRKDFWMGVAFLFVLSVGSKFIGFELLRIMSLIVIAPTICVHGKRLHDAGHTAWWVTIPIGFEFVVSLVWAQVAMPSPTQSYHFDANVALVLNAVQYVTWPIWNIWLGTRKSQPQDNKFGPGPEGASVAEVFE
jgi:uncharacterized membrane protein YhaH (DUF805 family)